MRFFVIKTLLFLLCFFVVERACHRETHGFRLHKVQSSLLPDPKWEVSPPEMEPVKAALSQPYHFLNSGGECYVFNSSDGKYVLKLFKHHHMRPKSPLDWLFPPLRKKRAEKLQTLFTSCRLAASRFAKETGLIYLHLSKTDHLNIKLKLFDPIGCVHKLDLDQYEFALQKKASMAYPTLTALVEAGEIEGAKLRLASLLDLIERRSEVGLADHDARKRNFGFIGLEAIELDLGSFTLNEELKAPAPAKKALMLETLKLRRWIKKYHPELSEFLEEELHQRLNKNL